MRSALVAALLLLAGAAPAQEAADPADADYAALLESWKAKRHAEALGLAESFLAEHPDYRYAPAVLYVGGNAALNARRYGRAEALHRELVRRFPDYKKTDEARNELVTALSRQRKLAECMAQCDANLEADPGSALVHRWVWVKAECLFRQFRFEEAGEAFRAFLSAFPASSLAERARAYLERIDPGWTVDESGVIAGYAGKYAADPRFRAALEAVPGCVEEGCRRLEERLGVDLRGRTGFLLLFEDAGDRAVDRGTTFTVGIGGKPVEVIRSYAEYVVLSLPDFRSRVVHEMKHAGFRGLMGQAYLELPRWVREGLAVWGAGQLPLRRDAILGNCVFSGGDPLALIDPLEDPVHDHDDYLVDALAFEWLERRQAGAVKAFCRRLIAGEDHRQAFAELAGMPFDQALESVLAYARGRVAQALGPAHRRFLEIRAGLFAARSDEERKAWLEGGGRAALLSWLEENPGHLLEPNARYRLGKTLVQAGEHEEGRRWLRRVVDEDFERSTICDDALLWVARSWEREGKADEAAATWEVLRRDYSWSTAVRRSAE